MAKSKQTVPNIYQYAHGLLRDGLSDDEINARLMGQGLAEPVARELIDNLRHTRDANQRQKAYAKLASGIPMSLVGLIFLYTALSGILITLVPALLFLSVGIVRLIGGLSYYLKRILAS